MGSPRAGGLSRAQDVIPRGIGGARRESLGFFAMFPLHGHHLHLGSGADGPGALDLPGLCRGGAADDGATGRGPRCDRPVGVHCDDCTPDRGHEAHSAGSGAGIEGCPGEPRRRTAELGVEPDWEARVAPSLLGEASRGTLSRGVEREARLSRARKGRLRRARRARSALHAETGSDRGRGDGSAWPCWGGEGRSRDAEGYSRTQTPRGTQPPARA